MAILMVDDSQDLRETTVMLLETYLGQECIQANNGQEGYDHYRRRASDINLILTDNSMPVLDGLGFLEKLTSFPDPPPRLMLSGDADKKLYDLVQEYGAQGLLRKPILEPLLLVNIVRELLQDKISVTLDAYAVANMFRLPDPELRESVKSDLADLSEELASLGQEPLSPERMQETKAYRFLVHIGPAILPYIAATINERGSNLPDHPGKKIVLEQGVPWILHYLVPEVFPQADGSKSLLDYKVKLLFYLGISTRMRL